MEQMHTPEPWKDAGLKIIGNGYNVATVNSHRTIEGAANAVRIVACVNYCAGMTADQLTCDSAEIVREELDRVTAERDEMANVLAMAVKFADANCSFDPSFAAKARMLLAELNK